MRWHIKGPGPSSWPGKRSAGFTVIEALVALAILAVILSVLVPAFISNAQINGRSERRAQAASAIEQVLDQKRTLPVDAVHFPASGQELTTVNVGGRDLTVRLTYCKVSGNCTANSRMVTAEALSDGRVLMTAETILTEVNYVGP